MPSTRARRLGSAEVIRERRCRADANDPGCSVDAGPGDAGADAGTDAGNEDAGNGDAGSDAGADAGFDAGLRLWDVAWQEPLGFNAQFLVGDDGGGTLVSSTGNALSFQSFTSEGRGEATLVGAPPDTAVSAYERDGFLVGTVESVDHYPSTRAGMMGALRNEQLVDSFIQAAGGAPIAVRARLTVDKATPSGFRWSSGAGPGIVLTSGTRCNAAVITRTQRPIALVFPVLDNGG